MVPCIRGLDFTIILHSRFQRTRPPHVFSRQREGKNTEIGENQSASPSAAALLPHFDAPRLLHLAAPSSLRLAHRSLDAMVARRIHANLVQSGESLDHHLIDPFSTIIRSTTIYFILHHQIRIHDHGPRSPKGVIGCSTQHRKIKWWTPPSRGPHRASG